MKLAYVVGGTFEEQNEQVTALMAEGVAAPLVETDGSEISSLLLAEILKRLRPEALVVMPGWSEDRVSRSALDYARAAGIALVLGTPDPADAASAVAWLFKCQAGEGVSTHEPLCGGAGEEGGA